jgi:hypothetical protein
MKMQILAKLDKTNRDTGNTCKGLKLSDGQSYDRSSEYTAVVAGATA